MSRGIACGTALKAGDILTCEGQRYYNGAKGRDGCLTACILFLMIPNTPIPILPYSGMYLKWRWLRQVVH
jgi:hypothetical protein